MYFQVSIWISIVIVYKYNRYFYFIRYSEIHIADSLIIRYPYGADFYLYYYYYY